MRNLLVQADGGSRGNPGLAGAGAAVIDDATGEVLAKLGVFVGVSTNNVAEYHGLIAGLKTAYEIDEDARIHVQLDSKLIVEQMSGRWKIKHPDMKELAQEAFAVIGARPVVFEWIPREKNTLADSLANRAMDEQRSFETMSR